MSAELHVGITGTREPLPDSQARALAQVIGKLAARVERESAVLVVHHGLCTGADEAAHSAARDAPSTVICGHPGTDARNNSPYRMRASEGFAFIHPEKPYQERNRDIVRATAVLIACPAWPETDPRSRRSGTWATIRYARKADADIIYIWPDGEIDAWCSPWNEVIAVA